MNTPYPDRAPKMVSGSEPGENAFALSVCSAVPGGELKPEIASVARYFGGSRYMVDTRTRDHVQQAADLAIRIVSPQISFVITPIRSLDRDGTLLSLSGGQSLPLPDGFCRRFPPFLAAAIGTLGKELESECRRLASQHDLYQSMLLDAVGTAMLDLLDTRIHAMIDRECRKSGLYIGMRFAPGLNGYPMVYQQTIFELVDGLSIDVCLNEAFVMNPAKSISFFSFLDNEHMDGPHSQSDKCHRCQLTHCQFRKGPADAGIGTP